MSEFLNIKKGTKKKSYTDLAYNAIRDLIIREEIKSGDLISENQIAEYLQMSRTPVREAIRRLEAEGILDVKKGLGTFLKSLSFKDIRDIYEVREALEIISAETAINNITTEEANNLKEKFLTLREKYQIDKSISHDKFSELDDTIHNLILDRSENEYIKNLMSMINFNIQRYRMLSFKVSYNLEESTKQHLDLLDSILKRDLNELKYLLSEHIRWSLKILQENLSEL
ncbi:MAG: GntR family transcriptional regulator [Eubacteriaceae bacterium]